MTAEIASADAELLMTYLRGGPEAVQAFERLVAAHGGMVYQTCMRILGRRELAEDAAQSAFLILARRAGAVHENVGAFLHGVAFNEARKIRDAEVSRKAREKESARMVARRDSIDGSMLWEEVRPRLDEAIGGLPGAQRTALVLHYFEGKSHSEVARAMNVSEGAVASHINRATNRLRERLAAGGTCLSAAALASLLGSQAGSAVCPEFLLSTAGKLAFVGAGGSAAAVHISSRLAAKKAVGLALGWKIAAAISAVLAGTAVVTVAVLSPKGEPPKPAPAASTPSELRPGAEPSTHDSVHAGPGKAETRDAFVAEFDALGPNEWSQSELVRLQEPGGEVTAIASRAFPGGAGEWKPDEYIELCRRTPDDMQLGTLFAVPERMEVHIRIKSERAGRCYLDLQPAGRRSTEEGLASPEFQVGPEWREIVIQGSALTPYRNHGVQTPDLVVGLGIGGISIYGYETGRVFVDRISVSSAVGEVF